MTVKGSHVYEDWVTIALTNTFIIDHTQPRILEIV